MKKRYYLPHGMRYSTLGERKEFYEKEFDFRKVQKWFGKGIDVRKLTYAVIIGRHTRVYPKRFKTIMKEIIVISDFKDLDEVQDYFVQYLPEGVYCDRNIYRDSKKCGDCAVNFRRSCWNCENFVGQTLLFDLDPENIDCPVHGNLEEKMEIHQTLGFCEIEFNALREQTLRMYRELRKTFKKIKVVYSGRGFHIHISDDKAIRMTRKQRANLASRLLKKGFPMDEWVTTGDYNLMRLPYSLHAMVSRIALPLTIKELEKFNPVKNKKCKPKFL